jgi:hypothetical protein
MSKILEESKKKSEFGAFVVYDDGIAGCKYSVYAHTGNGIYSFICSGMDMINATAVAESLQKANAGNSSGPRLLLE